jgi:hypothetical protein
VRAAVAGAVRNVTFVEAGTAGGIVDLLGANEKHTANGKAVQMQTKTLEDILSDANAPTYIDYLSLDSEGSELDILSTFPFWKYRFGAVTIETNGEEPKRTKIRQLMSYHGYTLERDALGQDDWFVSSCVSPAKTASFAVRYNDGRVARSRLRKKSQRLSTRTAGIESVQGGPPLPLPMTPISLPIHLSKNWFAFVKRMDLLQRKCLVSGNRVAFILPVRPHI